MYLLASIGVNSIEYSSILLILNTLYTKGYNLTVRQCKQSWPNVNGNETRKSLSLKDKSCWNDNNWETREKERERGDNPNVRS